MSTHSGYGCACFRQSGTCPFIYIDYKNIFCCLEETFKRLSFDDWQTAVQLHDVGGDRGGVPVPGGGGGGARAPARRARPAARRHPRVRALPAGHHQRRAPRRARARRGRGRYYASGRKQDILTRV